MVTFNLLQLMFSAYFVILNEWKSMKVSNRTKAVTQHYYEKSLKNINKKEKKKNQKKTEKQHKQ